jgi:hypothetical protein
LFNLKIFRFVKIPHIIVKVPKNGIKTKYNTFGNLANSVGTLRYVYQLSNKLCAETKTGINKTTKIVKTIFFIV